MTRQIMKLLPVILLLCIPAGAAPVYQWVDAEGVTHFSETPPDATPGADTQVRQLELDTASPSAGDDYYSVANQAARMEQRRLEAQAARTRELEAQAAADRARAAALAAEAAPAPDTDAAQKNDTVYLPAWGYRPAPRYRHPPPGYGDRHRHPPAAGTQPWPVDSLRPPGPRPWRPR